MSGNPGVNNQIAVSGRMLKETDTVVNVANAFYIDPDGNVQLVPIDLLHTLVHVKKMHTVSSRQATVAATPHTILLQASATKDMHVRIAFSSEDFAFFDTYEDVVPVGGTTLVPFNRVLATPSTILGTVKKNITSFTGGAARGGDFVGSSGAASVRAGGTGAADIESVIPAGHNMLISLTRTETGTKHTGIIVNLYERSPLDG